MDFDHIPWQAPLAGALGGVVRALTLRLPIVEALSSIVVGSICAVYLGPLAEPLISKLFGTLVVDDTSRVGLAGFVIGLGGIAASGVVMDLWKGLRAKQRQSRRNEP